MRWFVCYNLIYDRAHPFIRTNTQASVYLLDNERMHSNFRQSKFSFINAVLVYTYTHIVYSNQFVFSFQFTSKLRCVMKINGNFCSENDCFSIHTHSVWLIYSQRKTNLTWHAVIQWLRALSSFSLKSTFNSGMFYMWCIFRALYAFSALCMCMHA